MRLLLIFTLLLPASALAELAISDARIKNLPASVPVRAGYMTIHNPGAGAVRILSVASGAFAEVEIHRSFMQDGMARMEPVGELLIEAGASVQLAPGGLHLMMMQPAQATSPGQQIDILLRLDDGSEQRVTMKVIK